jgi:hypothetical protein
VPSPFNVGQLYQPMESPQKIVLSAFCRQSKSQLSEMVCRQDVDSTLIYENFLAIAVARNKLVRDEFPKGDYEFFNFPQTIRFVPLIHFIPRFCRADFVLRRWLRFFVRVRCGRDGFTLRESAKSAGH